MPPPSKLNLGLTRPQQPEPPVPCGYKLFVLLYLATNLEPAVLWSNTKSIGDFSLYTTDSSEATPNLIIPVFTYKDHTTGKTHATQRFMNFLLTVLLTLLPSQGYPSQPCCANTESSAQFVKNLFQIEYILKLLER